MTQTVAVLVPGITGTTLVKKGALLPVWPDQVIADPSNAVNLLTQSGLEPGHPILYTPNVPPRPAYAALIAYFQSLGYEYVTQSESLPQTSGNVLVGFGYDWRQPNEQTAALLEAMLAQISSTYGPACNIWLIAHSMGGLISRYVLESGMASGAAWSVRGLITLGTPHLGAPLALSAITGEIDISDLLDPDLIEQYVDMPAYPSAFQLLPPAQIGFVTDSSAQSYSIYDSSSPVAQLLVAAPPAGFGAPPANFTAATDFFHNLNDSADQAGRPNYYIVYGSGLPTVDAFAYTPSAGTLTQQLTQQTGQDGDGIVPQTSALFTNGWVSASYSAGPIKHGMLPSDAGVLGQIATWLSAM